MYKVAGFWYALWKAALEKDAAVSKLRSLVHRKSVGKAFQGQGRRRPETAAKFLQGATAGLSHWPTAGPHVQIAPSPPSTSLVERSGCGHPCPLTAFSLDCRAQRSVPGAKRRRITEKEPDESLATSAKARCHSSSELESTTGDAKN